MIIDKGQPVMIAITGANGAGKSTLAAQISKERGIPFICPDVPSGEDRHDETLVLAAQKIAMRESYAHDDVFRKTKIRESILSAKMSGFWIEAHIVLTQGPETCIERVQERANHGGHWHSEAYIRRHYSQALMYARRIARDIADEVHVYDNESLKVQKVMIMQDNHLQITGDIHPWVQSTRKAIEQGIRRRKNQERVNARRHRQAMAAQTRNPAPQPSPRGREL